MKRKTELSDEEQEYMHQLFERYAGLFRSLSMRYSDDREEQNDLIQDTLLRRSFCKDGCKKQGRIAVTCLL